jgi:hypothetical protein
VPGPITMLLLLTARTPSPRVSALPSPAAAQARERGALCRRAQHAAQHTASPVTGVSDCSRPLCAASPCPQNNAHNAQTLKTTVDLIFFYFPDPSEG